MVKNGSKSASNVQAGAAGELGRQNHGLSWQRYGCSGLVSRKRVFREDLLLLAKAAIPGAVGTEDSWADLTPEERYNQRLEQAKPVLDAMLAWANTRTA